MADRCKKGFRKKGNKCVRKSKRSPNIFRKLKKSIKKKYNPFKMWGSYVGLAIILFILIGGMFFGEFCGEFCEAPYGIEFLSTPYMLMLFFPGMFLFPILGGTFSVVLIFLLWSSIGFLIGYGIHSIIRRFK